MLGRAPDQKPNQGADKQNQLDPFEGLQFVKWGGFVLGVTIFAGTVANYVKSSVNELRQKHEPSGVYLSGDAYVKSLEENNKDKVTTEELKDTPVKLPPLPELLER
jgi:hypothetical protein